MTVEVSSEHLLCSSINSRYVISSIKMHIHLFQWETDKPCLFDDKAVPFSKPIAYRLWNIGWVVKSLFSFQVPFHIVNNTISIGVVEKPTETEASILCRCILV